VEATEGLRLLDLDGIAQVMRSEKVEAKDIEDAVRRYKLGVTEDPWQKIDRAKLRNAEAFIHERVKGQDRAVRHMLDIITRAATGVGGARGGRPRGVAFLAGPTGVGKTELAKSITELLFGDERAYIRFDMSEFSAEHADQRLIGAPPGYVGYDTGGELTNAIRERPFSVLLFDEVDKAHPRILDKFLQVLDDGVLTSGRGERVYFSESLIIFTSNLGMCAVGEDRLRRVNATSADTYEEMETKVRAEIERHFKLEIGRPELLNRIGENIIVFDFIRPALAEEIFGMILKRTTDDIRRDQRIDVQISTAALDALKAHCLCDLSNGGRGIRNFIEVGFVNPLARLIFETDLRPGASILITDASVGAAGVTLKRG
jgi:ATP-dependent Clp protease ATP-binding subunit ClpA